jgi:hypothetical protein
MHRSCRQRSRALAGLCDLAAAAAVRAARDVRNSGVYGGRRPSAGDSFSDVRGSQKRSGSQFEI